MKLWIVRRVKGKEDKLLKRVFNLRNIYGGISFVSLICAPGAVESEMYITAVVLVAILGITAFLAMKEEGQKK